MQTTELSRKRSPDSYDPARMVPYGYDDTDYGTPARVAEKTVSLTMDGRAVTAPAGTSVMRAAAEAGINIPKLCATDSLEAFGSCRLCLVEIEGKDGRRYKGFPASCTTPVEDGMKVQTQTPKLQALNSTFWLSRTIGAADVVDWVDDPPMEEVAPNAVCQSAGEERVLR